MKTYIVYYHIVVDGETIEDAAEIVAHNPREARQKFERQCRGTKVDYVVEAA